MGKKSRRKHEAAIEPDQPDRPSIWSHRWARVAAAIAVFVAFGGIGIAAVTVMGGASLSDSDGDETKLTPPEPLGEQPAAARSRAGEVLAAKAWSEMTDEERLLVASEAVRAFHDMTFRTRNELVLALDVWRREGETLASRVYFESGEPGPDGEPFLYERTAFFCDLAGGGFRVFRYLKSPTDVEFEIPQTGVVPRAWDDVVFGADWAGDVGDLGLRSIGGRQARGFVLAFRSVSGGEPVQAEYWFDVETAQLLEWAEVLAKRSDMEALAYRLEYVAPPPIDIAGAVEIPDCVQDIIEKLEG